MYDILIKNAKVYDKTEAYQTPRCVGIKDGIICEISTQPTDTATRIIDAKGGTLFPGFIDSHMHPAIAGPCYMYEIVLNGITGKEDLLDEIRRFVEEHPDEESYSGYGYLESDFGEKGPKKEWLDEICPDKPMYISGISGHAAWVNSKAIEMVGLTAQTELPKGSEVPLNEAGEPSGLIRGVMAMKFFDSVRPKMTVEKYKAALKYAIDYCASEGFTTVVDCEINSEDLRIFRAYKELAEENKLSCRVRGTWLFSDDMAKDAPIHLSRMKKLSDELTSDMFRMDTVKFFADGIFEEYTGALSQPYSDREDGWCGELNWETEELKKVFKLCDDNDWQIHVHAIGDAAIGQTLDALAYVQEVNGKKDRRPEIAHVEYLTEAQKERFAELGVTAATAAYWAVIDEGFLTFLRHALGDERAYKVFPIKSLMDKGVLVTSHSDYNVSDPEFDLLLYSGVTRMVPQKIYDDYYAGKQFHRDPNPDAVQDGVTMKPFVEGNEFLTVEEVIDTATINGAKAVFLEEETGSLAAGKCADMVLYKEDLYSMAKKDIESVCGKKPRLTITHGTVVFEEESDGE